MELLHQSKRRITTESRPSRLIQEEQNSQTKSNAENYIEDDDDCALRSAALGALLNEIVAPTHSIKRQQSSSALRQRSLRQ